MRRKDREIIDFVDRIGWNGLGDVGGQNDFVTLEDGLTKIETAFVNDMVWLSVERMAELFQRDRSVIGKYIHNIFKESELKKESVWAKFAHTADDGKNYQNKH